MVTARDSTRLSRRWNETWSRLDETPPAELLDQLITAYEEPHRAYHTLEHLAECFGHLDAAPARPADPAALELALWFHDAVYDVRARDNEERSAGWAARALAFLGEERVERIRSLILATRHDSEPAGADQELLVDVDLAILGAEPGRFAEYERQIRREYAWVPGFIFRRTRAKILRALQRRPTIYRTPYFRELLEDRARQNLERSLAALRKPHRAFLFGQPL